MMYGLWSGCGMLKNKAENGEKISISLQILKLKIFELNKNLHKLLYMLFIANTFSYIKYNYIKYIRYTAKQKMVRGQKK